jgi:hypothetical protein
MTAPWVLVDGISRHLESVDGVNPKRLFEFRNTRNLDSEMSGDSNNAFLHCGDVVDGVKSGTMSTGACWCVW